MPPPMIAISRVEVFTISFYGVAPIRRTRRGHASARFCEPGLNGAEIFLQNGERSFGHCLGVEALLHGLLPFLTHDMALLDIVQQPAQAARQLGGIIGL